MIHEATVQYRLTISKNDERLAGPDEADVVLAVAAEAIDGVGAAVAFMRGKLKASGDSGAILEVLRSGAADQVFAELSV